MSITGGPGEVLINGKPIPVQSFTLHGRYRGAPVVSAPEFDRVLDLLGGGTMIATGRITSIDPQFTAAIWCQLDHAVHDGFSCVPANITLGDS